MRERERLGPTRTLYVKGFPGFFSSTRYGTKIKDQSSNAVNSVMFLHSYFNEVE